MTLGAAQERALDVWGVVHGPASGILHGRSAGREDAVLLCTELLHAARELLVHLPERAARVLELTALMQPGAGEAAELARWADPRAEAHFFRSGPAPVWLGVLAEHAPHLLLRTGRPAGSGRPRRSSSTLPAPTRTPYGRGPPRRLARTRRSAGRSRWPRPAARLWTRCWASRCATAMSSAPRRCAPSWPTPQRCASAGALR
ncbi:hypothetical protein ACPXCS_34075 [Streptomyces sp. DT190]|uniref:hypothetical protein n=1 Tax=unclassified Streptomyces TaxID=2593676 RepID=UPI003CE84B08